MDTNKLLVTQLMASRSTLYAAIAQIDVSLLALGVDVDRLDAEPTEPCVHPADQIKNHHETLDDGPDDWECQACGQRQSEPFHPHEG